MKRPSCLVLTLYSGERDFDACVRSLRDQVGVAIDHKVISHLPNREAHETLYREISRNRKSYDSFVKLDGDMVLRSPCSLEQLIRPILLQSTDHLLSPVHDYYVDGNIYGISSFSGDAEWPVNLQEVFVDENPSVLKPLIRVGLKGAAEVFHCRHASLRQAFQFGFHRGLKAVAAREVSVAGAHNSLLTLVRVAQAYRRTGGVKRLLALEGALWGRNAAPDTEYKSGTAMDDLYLQSRDRIRRGLTQAAVYWTVWGETELIRRRLVRKAHHLALRRGRAEAQT